MPLFVVVTKVDKCSKEQIDQSTRSIFDILLTEKGKVALPVHTAADVSTAAQIFREGRWVHRQYYGNSLSLVFLSTE